MKVYFDNAATTPLDKEVLNEMLPYMTQHFGNPNSVHSFGRTTRAAIEKARKQIASYLNASTAEIFFTSCGTESNNMVIKNAVHDLGVQRIISSRIEHHCVLHTVEFMESEGVEVQFVKLKETGEPDYEHLEALLGSSTRKTLVSLMHCNNELGTLTDVDRVGNLCRAHGALYHSDCVQTIGWYPFDLQKQPVDFISGSGHKIHGPKGIGFVFIRSSSMIKPFIHGGSQERNMRAGTEYVYGIVGLGKAVEMAVQNMEANRAAIGSLKQYFIQKLQEEVPQATINGAVDAAKSSFRVLNVSLPVTPKTEMVLFNLDMAGIAASGGSACSSGSLTGSHVLAGIHAPADRVAVRFSFSRHNTREEVDYTVSKLKTML